MLTIAIVVLHFNGEKDTLECLKSLKNIQYPMSRLAAKRANFQCQIIVVDNGSSDESLNKVRSFINEFSYKLVSDTESLQDVKKERLSHIRENSHKTTIKLVENQINLGFSGGNNLGIRHALENGADYVLILNNDTIADKDFLQNLVEVAEKDIHIGIVSPKIYFAKGFEFHKDRYLEKDLGHVFWYAGGIMDWKNIIGKHRGVDEVDKGQYEEVMETDFASGCCMMLKKEVIEKVGLFDENYFLYYEDNDLCKRVRLAGYKILYVPQAVIWHKNAGSAGGSGSSLQDYYITRNRLMFGIKYAPFNSKAALIRESLKLLVKGRKWQKRGVIDFYTRRFGKGSYNQ